MVELPRCYTTLFHAVTNALDSIDKQNYGTAKQILIRGQCEAEGQYIADTEIERREREKQEKAESSKEEI